MSSSRKEVGRVKLPAKFAELGLKIDPTKMKPDAWMNRKNKQLGKKPTTPTLSESKHPIIDNDNIICSTDEILTDIGKTYFKPTIPKNIRRKRTSKNKNKNFITHQQEEDETSADGSEETIMDTDAINELQDLLNNQELSITSQLQLIEQLKHDKLVLEEWKNEIGLNAIAKCKNVEIQLEMEQNNTQRLQLQIESLQTQNHAQEQQIQTYQDEIGKFNGEKDKLISQITHFEQLLNEQYMINKRLESKEKEFNDLKTEFESNKLGLNNSLNELKYVSKELNELKNENNKYLELFNKYSQAEIKNKTELNNKEYEILELTKKNEEIYDKLKRETVENRKQLKVANDFANDLSDQLEEIQNFASSPRPNNNIKRMSDGNESDSSLIGGNIGYGKPLFEKRKTLTIKYEHSLKLPNMSDIINDNKNNTTDIDTDVESIDGDEYYNQNNNQNNNKKKTVFSVKMNNKQLAPITQLNEYDNDEKHNNNNTFSYSSNTLHTFDSSNETLNINDINNNNNNKNRNTAHIPQLTDEGLINNENKENEIYINAKYVTHNEQDKIDKLLRKIAGSSYYKFRNGTNVPMINSETRYKLKYEMIKYINIIRNEYVNKTIELDTIIIQYKRLSEEWENKYKTLKREIKKRKLRSEQTKQKISEPVVGGCKFWSWGLNPKWFIDITQSNGKEGSNPPPHGLRFYVADDSDDTENNSII